MFALFSHAAGENCGVNDVLTLFVTLEVIEASLIYGILVREIRGGKLNFDSFGGRARDG